MVHAVIQFLYRAQEAHLRWSPNGQAVLIHTHTDVDTSGVSYYGSTGLYLVHADGGFEVTVPLPKDGPISDAQWAPTVPAQFIVVAGRMPAGATLYNVKVSKPKAHLTDIAFACYHSRQLRTTACLYPFILFRRLSLFLNSGRLIVIPFALALMDVSWLLQDLATWLVKLIFGTG